MIKSLLHFNDSANLAKDTIRDVLWTVNGTVASSPNGKFGKCLSMNNNGYLQNNTIDLSLDKEWTLDMWSNATSYARTSTFSINSSPSYSPRQGIFIENGDLYFANKRNNTWDYYPLDLPSNVWVHFAIVNTLSTIYGFVNGVKKVEYPNKDVNMTSTPEVLIGLARTISSTFIGLIDEFRISDKALWTSDFTPPAYETSLTKYIYIDKNNAVMGMKE